MEVIFPNVVGGHRSALYFTASHFVCGHYISYDRILLVTLQGLLVLLRNILYISVLRVPWDADSFTEPKFSSGFHISNGSIHDTESFLRLPYARTGKPFQLFFILQFSLIMKQNI